MGMGGVMSGGMGMGMGGLIGGVMGTGMYGGVPTGMPAGMGMGRPMGIAVPSNSTAPSMFGQQSPMMDPSMSSQLVCSAVWMCAMFSALHAPTAVECMDHDPAAPACLLFLPVVPSRPSFLFLLLLLLLLPAPAPALALAPAFGLVCCAFL